MAVRARSTRSARASTSAASGPARSRRAPCKRCAAPPKRASCAPTPRSGRSVAWGRQQTELDRAHGRLRAIRDAQLGDDVLDVYLDGAHADPQRARNLAVGLSLRQKLRHHYLAWGQPLLGRLRLARRPVGEALEEGGG